MGAALSKASSTNTIDQLNNIITNVIVSNASSCSATSAISQQVNLGNIGGNLSGVDISASSVVSLDCLQSSLNDAAIQSQVSQQLSQYAQSQSEAGMSFFSVSSSQSDSQNLTKLANNIANNIKIDNIKQCVAANIVSQKLQAGDVAGNVSSISLNVSSQSISKCIQTDKNVSSSINTLATTIDQTSKTSSLAGLSTTAIVAIIVILLIICCCSSSVGVVLQSQ